VVVDYAHTPDALEKALTTLRAAMQPEGKLICVFGCGGDRDRGKRPLMGEIATSYADHTVVTSDNPRTEKPERIINDIEAGLKAGSDYQVEADRAAAIALAVNMAAPVDVILIAGKGHETYQEIRGVRHHFNDVEVAEAVLKARSA
jgi:UDP-N-acetylmuramoyl-L-alanyl-D-glutamate--2,6-diaminopimelate ligase